MAQLSVQEMRLLERKERFVRQGSIKIKRGLIQAYEGLHRRVSIVLREEKVVKRDEFGINRFIDSVIRVGRRNLVAIYMSNFKDLDLGEFEVSMVVRDQIVADFIRRIDLHLKDIAIIDSQRIVQVIADVIASQDPSRMVPELEKIFVLLTTKRALSISRNLVAQAYSESRMSFWSEVAPGVAKRKRWLPSIGGLHDRIHHNGIPKINGDVDFNATFQVISPFYGVIQIRYPNDFMWPGEAINCKCDVRILFNTIFEKLFRRKLTQELICL